MNDNARKLYDALSQEYDLGTFEQFSSDIQDENKRRKLYDATIQEYDFGEYDSFNKQLGFGGESIATIQPKAVEAPQKGDNAWEAYGKYDYAKMKPKEERDEYVTATEEQRRTEIPQYHSVADSLDVYKSPGAMSQEEYSRHLDDMFDGKRVADNKARRFMNEAETAQMLDDKFKDMRKFGELKGGQGITAGRKDIIENNGRFYTPVGSYDSYEEAAHYIDANNLSKEDKALQKDVRKDIENDYYREQLSGLYDTIKDLKDKQRVYDIQEQNKYRKERSFGQAVKDAVMNIPVAEMQQLQGDIPSSGYDISAKGRFVKEQNDALTAAGRLYNEAQAIMSAAKSGNFIDGLNKALGSIDTWSSQQQARDNIAIGDVVKKWEEGRTLTKAEQALLESLAVKTAINNEYQDEISNWYKAGEMVGEMAPFMVEMMINPLSGLSKTSATKFAKWATKKYGKRLAAKVAGAIGGLGGAVAGGYGMALTTGLPSLGTGIQERMLGKTTYDFDKNGDIEFAGQTEKKGLLESGYEELTAKAIDNATEMLGAGYVSSLGSKIAKTAKGKKLFGWLDRLSDTKWGRGFKEFRKATKWNGPIEEFLEEIHAGIANTALVGDQSLKELFDKDNLATIAIGVAIPGVAISTAQTAGGIAQGAYKAGASDRRKMAEAGNRGTEIWRAGGKLEQWQDFMNSTAFGSLEDTDRLLTRIHRDNSLSNEEKAVAFDYAIHTLRLKTALGVKDAMNDGRASAIDNMLSDIYSSASSEAPSADALVEAESKLAVAEREAKDALGLTDKSIEDFMGERTIDEVALENEDLRHKLLDYFKVKAEEEGRRDAIEEMKLTRYAEVDKSIDNTANKDDGNIYRTKTLDGVEIFITGGKVVLDNEGYLDVNQSEGLVALMPNGRNESVRVDKLREKIEVSNAQEAKDARHAEIDAEIDAELSAPKNVFSVNAEDGAHTIEVVEDNGNGFFTIVDNGEQKIIDEAFLYEISGGQFGKPAEGVASVASENATEMATEAPATDNVQTAVEPIPTETRGKVKRTAYHVVPIERTLEDLASNELTEDEKIQFTQANIDEINSELQKVLKQEPKMGADIQAYKAAKAQWTVARDEWQKRLDYYNELLNRLKQPVQTSEVAPVVETPQATNEMQPIAQAPIDNTAMEVAQETQNMQPVQETVVENQSGENNEMVEPVGNSEQLTNDVKTEDVNQSEDNLEMVAEGENAPLAEISNDERAEMEARIVDWLSEENLERAEGKTREEIFDEFGNELEPIAYIPKQYISLVSADLKDQRIYCGKGYFIDHALRNHAKDGKQLNVEDVDVSKYLNIQSVLDNPDSVKETYVDGKRTIVFIKKIGRYFAELTQVEEDGKIVLHKSMFNQKKEPYAKLNDIRSKGTSSEGGVSSISHTADAAPAISLESRGDVVSNSTVSSVSEDRNYVSNTQENTQKSDENAENGGEITETTANPTDSEPTEQPETNEVANAGPVNMETLQLNMGDEDFNALLNGGDKTAISEYLAEMDGLLRIGVGSPLDGQEALREEYRKAVEQYGKENIPTEVMDDLNSRMQPYSDLSRAIFDRKYALQDKLREIEASEAQANEQAEKEAKAEHKQTAFGGFLAGKTDVGASTAEKALSKKYNFDGKVMTVAEFVEDAVGNGNVKLSAIEEPKYKGASRAAWNRMDARQQEADAKRVKESGTKTVYTVNDHDLGKTAYDYAKFLLDKKAEQEKADAKKAVEDVIKPFAKEKREETKPATEKIEDVGEKIGGARKDALKTFSQAFDNATVNSLVELPFAKAFKKPNLKKAVESGLMREEDALFYEAVFNALVNPNKPKLSRRVNNKVLKEWAEQTYDALQVLKDFVEADAQKRDELMARMLEDKFPTREKELTVIEQRKEWNKGTKAVWGDKTTPNPLWVTLEILKSVGYNAGDKVDIPFGVVKANVFGTGYELYNKKGDRLIMQSVPSVEDAIAQSAWLVKTKRGDMDTKHPVSSFSAISTKSEMGDSGRYRVLWGGIRNSSVKEFDSLEEANAFAEKVKGGVYPIQTVKRRYGYKIVFRNPLSGDRFYVNDIEFETEGEAKQYIEENYDAINELTNEILAKERGETKKEVTADDILEIAPVFKDGWKYAVRIKKEFANNMGNPLVLREFDSRENAMAFAEESKNEVYKTYKREEAEHKKFVFFDTGENSRIGEDYRGGKDVTAQDFMDTFGFRGVQFGNWTNQDDRQMAVNQAYDAFLDLAKLLGVSPKALSLNGELGMAFGSRGSGFGNAHYELGEVVINLTKTKGAGSLAHEWWHALDNYFARRANVPMGMVTDSRSIDMRPELREAYNNLLKMIDKSDYYKRSKAKGDYWGRMHEVTARLMAEWVDQSLKDKGELNTFLSRGANTGMWKNMKYAFYRMRAMVRGVTPMSFEEFEKTPEALAGLPYPSKEEVKEFGDAMRNIFDTVQEQETEDGKVMFYNQVENSADILDNVEKELSLEQTNIQKDEKRILPERIVDRILRGYSRIGRGEQPTGEIADIARRYNEGRTIIADSPLLRNTLKLLRRLTNNEINEGLLPFFERRLQKENNEQYKKEYQDIIELIKRFRNRNERRAVINELSGAELDEDIPLSKIDELFGLYNSDNGVAQLYERVRRIAEQIGLSFSFTELEDVQGGVFDLADNRIMLNAHILYSPFLNNQEKASVIAHEMIHAVSCYAVMEYENGNTNLSPELTKAAKSIVDIYNKKVKGNPDLVHGVYDVETKGMQNVPDYGTTSAYEMVAELANPDFAEKLKGIDYDGRSVWRRIWDAIKSIFVGRKGNNDTAYDALMSAFDALVENFDGKAYEQARKNEAVFNKITDGATVQEDVSIDNVSTQPLTFTEKITNSVLEASARNKENLTNLTQRSEALRAYGSNLANVLKQMRAAQRVYDKSTVDTLMKMAKMYFKNAQLLGHITPYEAGRIMSVLHGAVGKHDVTNAANKLVGILVDAHSNELQGLLDKAAKTKAKKVNASGVEVMGSLDKMGQIALEAYNEAVDLDEKAIEDKLFEAQNDTAHPDEAEARINGLMMAREYVTDIKQKKQEIKDLQALLKKKAKDAREGNMSRREWKEFKKATVEAIMEDKLGVIDAYHSLIYRMSTDISKASARAKAFQKSVIDHTREIQYFANSDMQGRSASAQGELPTKYNNAVLRGLMSGAPTFQYMLKKFGEKDVDGKGYLYDYFMGAVTKAADKEFNGRLGNTLLMEAKLKELFDKKMKIADLYKYMRADGTTLTYREGGEMREMEISQGQMLYIYMLNKMADGRMKLSGMGITGDVVAKMAEELPKELVAFADWVQDDFLTKLREKYNIVHERMFGAPMAAIENYFPIKVNKRSIGSREDISKDTENDKLSTMTGAIIKRTKNAAPIDLSVDALSALLDHINEMEHWAAFAEFNRDVNTLVNYNHFKNQVMNMSSFRYGSGKTLWENFRKTAKVVSGTYRPEQNAIDKAVLNISKGVTASKIAFRGYTAVKQVLSAPAFWSEASVDNLLFCYVNPKGSCEWAMEFLPGFKERWMGRMMGNEKLLPQDSDWKIWRNNFVKNATRIGMTPNAAVDALTVAQGARAVYRTKLEAYKKAGYTEQRANEKALQAAAEAYNESQQSSMGAYISPIQASGTAMTSLLTTFKNANFGYTRKTAQSLANIKRHTEKGYKEEDIAYMTKKFMREGLTEEQAKKLAERRYKRSLYKDSANVALYGFGLNMLWMLGGSAIYLLAGDDDEKKEELVNEALIRGALGSLDGIPLGETLANWATASMMGEDAQLRMPRLIAVNDFENIVQIMKSDRVRGAYELANMFIAMGIGVNPATFVDAFMSFADVEEWSAEEVAMIALKILNAPKSQLELLEVDKAMENGGVDATEVMRRYVEQRTRNQAPGLQGLYSDENLQKVWTKNAKRFDRFLDERLENVIEDDFAFRMFYDDADAMTRAKISEMREKYLKGDDKAFVKKELEDVINGVYFGAEKKTVYYGLANEDDLNEDFELKQMIALLSPVYSEYLKMKDGLQKGNFFNEHKDEIVLYKNLNARKSKMDSMKKYMQDNPGLAEKNMREIRKLRTEAMKLISGYNE